LRASIRPKTLGGYGEPHRQVPIVTQVAADRKDRPIAYQSRINAARTLKPLENRCIVLISHPEMGIRRQNVSTPNEPWGSGSGQYGSGQQQPGSYQQDPWAQGGNGAPQQQGGYGAPQGGYGDPQQGGYGGYQQGGYQQYPQGGGYSPFPQGGYAPGTVRGYLQGGPVDFKTAVTEAFRNMFNYNGRASRSAYWWFALAAVIAFVVLEIIGLVLKDFGLILDVLAWIAIALASIPLTVRRLHDTNRSGFWWFIGLVPFVGGIVLLVFALLEGTPGPNTYG
jgi:uncharacterized membrane protein YhaH (DUF805 family)